MDKKAKKTIVRVITFSAAAIAVMAVMVVRSEMQISKREEVLTAAEELAYMRAFSEAVSSIEDMNYSLEKARYITSPSLSVGIYSEIFSEAQSAAACLAILPFGGAELENTSAFVARIGDYCYALSKKAAAGIPRTAEENETIISLSQSTQKLASSLIDIQGQVYSEGLKLSALHMDDGAEEANTGSPVQAIENDFMESPSLVYDGPFSEHIEAMEPMFLEGKQEVSSEEALEKAEVFFDLRKGILTQTGEVSGRLPTYIFEGEDEYGKIHVQMTKTGGEALYMCRDAGQEGRGGVTREGALKLAQQFLDENGISEMRDTYTQQYGNSMVINFAYGKNDVICYSDLVKVTIDMSTGHIIGYEARGYIMSHTQRELTEPAISPEAAESAVSAELKVLESQLCVIPTAGKNEIYCIELKCESKEGKHYLLYINAMTGAEEKFLILLENENGTLSI